MSLRDVSTILWRERQLLELLLFKLEEEQLLLEAGRTRHLAQATREVEQVLEALRDAELSRAAEVDAVAPGLDLPPGPSLNALADAAPEPWGSLLADHRTAFRALTDEVQALATANRDLIGRGHQATIDLLGALGTGSSALRTYSPTGSHRRADDGPRLLDRAF